MEQWYDFNLNGEDYNTLEKKVDFYMRNHSSYYDLKNEAFISFLIQALTITGYLYSIFYLRIIPFNRFFLSIIVIQIALLLADVYFLTELLNLGQYDFFQQSAFSRQSSHHILTITFLKFLFGSPISGISNLTFWLSLSRLWKENDCETSGVDFYHALVLTSLMTQMLFLALIMVSLPENVLYLAYYLTLLVFSGIIEVYVYFKRNKENFLSKPVTYGFIYTGFYLILICAYLILQPDFYVVWGHVAIVLLSISIVLDLVILLAILNNGLFDGDSFWIKRVRYIWAICAPIIAILYLSGKQIGLFLTGLVHGNIELPHFITLPSTMFVFIAFLFAASLGFLVIISLVDWLFGNEFHEDYSYFNTKLNPISQKVYQLMLFYKRVDMVKNKAIDNLNQKLDLLNKELNELRKKLDNEVNNKENISAFNDGYKEGRRAVEREYRELLRSEKEISSKNREKEIFALLFGIYGINKLGKKDLDKITSKHRSLTRIYHPDGKDDVKELNQIMALINHYRDIFNKMAEGS